EEVVMPGGQRHAPKPGQTKASPAKPGQPRGGQQRSGQQKSRQHPPRPAMSGAPVDEDKIADVIRLVVGAAGMDLESVRVSAAGRRRLLRVVVDSDQGV